MSIDEESPVNLTAYVRGAQGTVTLSSNIAIGATFQQTVTFDRTLPNTNYGVLCSLEGAGNILGTLTAQPVAGTRTTTTVDILIKNSGLVALGLNVVVTAFAVYT